jgi:hypothetical protein
MRDYTYSSFSGGGFMTCRMLFSVIEEYSLFSYDKKIDELLGIQNNTWREYKCSRVLPKKHYKKLCFFMGINETEDDKVLCLNILEKYFDEKEAQDE